MEFANAINNVNIILFVSIFRHDIKDLQGRKAAGCDEVAILFCYLCHENNNVFETEVKILGLLTTKQELTFVVVVSLRYIFNNLLYLVKIN